jgi:hypothetical protein
MRWALRILSGLVALTAPFIWSVAQTGLSPTDEHLCDLARAWFGGWIPSGPQCVAHEWYGYLWAFGGIFGGGFLLYEIADWAWRKIRPTQKERGANPVDSLAPTSALRLSTGESGRYVTPKGHGLRLKRTLNFEVDPGFRTKG